MTIRMIFNDVELSKKFSKLVLDKENLSGRVFDIQGSESTESLYKTIEFLKHCKIPYILNHAYLGEYKYYELVKGNKKIKIENKLNDLKMEVIIF